MSREVFIEIHCTVEDDPRALFGPSATMLRTQGTDTEILNILCIVMKAKPKFRLLVTGALAVVEKGEGPTPDMAGSPGENNGK